MTGDGLVGRVAELGDHAARILLLTDLNSRVPVVIEETRERAILSGDNTERPALAYLPPDARVSSGQRVVTSGSGGVLPAGLPIGTVTVGRDGVPDMLSVVKRFAKDVTAPLMIDSTLTIADIDSTNLTGATVTFGGVAATGVVVDSPTQITVTSPATITAGLNNVQVTTSVAASSTAGTGDDFTYTAPVPTVTSLTPNTGPTSGGTSVVIAGTGFVSGATVKFGALSAASVTVNSPTSITAVSPATITPGTVSVIVTTSGGDSTPAGAQGTAADDFTYTTVAPTITSLSPTTGTTAGGTSVTITGTGFGTGATSWLTGVQMAGVNYSFSYVMERSWNLLFHCLQAEGRPKYVSDLHLQLRQFQCYDSI